MIIYRRNFINKPPLGSQLASSNLTNGLQIASLLNENGGLSDSFGRVYNIARQNTAPVAGSVGSAGINTLWFNTRQGRAFINRNAGTTGAIDFGAISIYGSFSKNQISFAAMCAADTNHVTGSRVIQASPVSGTTTDFALISVQNVTQWQPFIHTTGGDQNLALTMTHPNDIDWLDFVVCTYDGTTLKGYVNGRLGASSVISQNLNFTTTDHIYLTGWTGSNTQNDVSPVGCFYLWNRTLTAAEVQQLYLDPYWAVVVKQRIWKSGTAIIPPPTPPPAFGIATWGR